MEYSPNFQSSEGKNKRNKSQAMAIQNKLKNIIFAKQKS